MGKSTRVWRPLLLIGLGVGVGLLGPAMDALWLLIFATVLIVAGGAFFYTNMQHT